MKDRFKLIKPFGDYKKGRIFDSFGGLVRGIICDNTNQSVNQMIGIVSVKYEA